MKFLRVLAIILTILTLTFAVLLFTKADFNIETDLTDVIIIAGAAYALALSTIIRFVYRRVFLSGPVGKFFFGMFFFILGTALTPIFLVISIFGRIYRIRTTPEERRVGAIYTEESHHIINRDIWIASAKVAMDQIFDKEYSGLVRLDNGEELRYYRQVSIIKSAGKTYVLLSPADEDSDAEGIALAFAIAPYPGTEETTLVPVTNENLYRRIYSIYDSLLAEREIFNS